MVSPIRPSIATNKPTAPVVRATATPAAPAVKPTANGTPSGVSGGGGGEGNISVDEQKRIIKAADENGSGTKGDGLATRDDIYNYLMSQAPQSGTSDSLSIYKAEAKAKADALMKNLDVTHGDYVGGDNLVNAGDVDFVNKPIQYSFTYSNTPSAGNA